MKAVAVYCGSSPGAKPEYAAAARELGACLAEREITLVYGGGNVGIMGAVADGVLEAGGHVIGVIPRGLADKELAHEGASEMRVVDSMHERKAMMVDLSDAFVALPGGFGTFDELCEVVTWCQLGYEEKPIGILNVAGYFDFLLQQFDLAVGERFLQQQHRDLILADTDPAELLNRLAVFERGDVQKWIDRNENASKPMRQVGEISVLVRDYDEAIEFYTGALGFSLIEDTVLGNGKRWVRVRPGVAGPALLLAQADGEAQVAAVGNQSGGRVFLFLYTSDFDADYEAMRSRGVEFVEEPRDEPYGRVVVFRDLYGNKWDLIQRVTG